VTLLLPASSYRCDFFCHDCLLILNKVLYQRLG
jgi:hypothetical protein